MNTLIQYALVASGLLISLESRAQFRDILRKTDSLLTSHAKDDSAIIANDQHRTGSNSTDPNSSGSTIDKNRVNTTPENKNVYPQPTNGTSSQVHSGPAPTEHEMQGGIKQALQQALQNGIAKVSVTDGFFKDQAIKLLFPPEARKAEKTLRDIGLNQLCDKVILQLNRAAEDASKKAAPIFLHALKQMSIKDATAILTGAPNAATAYFQSHTTTELSRSFKPVIDSSLNKLHAKALYSQVVSKYNSFPLADSKVDADLSNYATNQAIQGLFTTLAQEEAKLREKSGLNASALVRKVFGYFNK